MKRRDLLMWGGGVAGVAAVGAVLGSRKLRVLQSLVATNISIPDHRVAVPSTTPRLVIARGKDAARNVRAVIERMGGLEQFISHNDTVLIKPNAAWDRVAYQAATTTPEVLSALILAVRDAGAKDVIVAECPVDNADKCFERTGIARAARDAGAKIIMPSESKYVEVKLPGKVGSWPILEPFARATKIINVPIAKHHGSARVTAGMKNWIGITDTRRSLFHAGLNESIVSLASLMKPTLTLVDATRILMRNGPRGGNLDDVRDAQALALSTDPVAVDCWATELLGARIEEVKYLELASQKQLGAMNYRDFAVEVAAG